MILSFSNCALKKYSISDHKIHENIILYPFLPPIESKFDLNIGFSLCAQLGKENLFSWENK